MDDLTRLAIERECGRLPLLFAKYADNGDHAALAALFTEDCEFARPFQPDYPFYGRAAVQAFSVTARRSSCATWSAMCWSTCSGEDEAKGTSYLAMLSSHKSTTPPQEAGGLYVGGFNDHYVHTEDGWKFKSCYGMVALHQGGAMPNIPAPADDARGLIVER